MTTPITEANATASQPKAESFVDWFNINSRMITTGAVVVALAAFGFWFVQRTALNAAVNSDRQLLVAKQSMNAGNAALAEADLKKVVDKYGDKPAGAEAGMLLAQLRLDKGDFPGAVAGLRDLASKVSSGPNAAQVRGLLGDAISQSGKPAEAAGEYERASGLSAGPNEKQMWLSKAARAYVAAGNAVQARKLYEALAAQSENAAVAAEARVRLGELTTSGKA